MFSGCRRSNGAQGLRVIVQSDRDAAYLDDRIEAFLHSMGVKLVSLLTVVILRANKKLTDS